MKVTPRTHAGRVTVFLNGEDVTFRCMEADDLEGTVRLMCGDPERHDWRWSPSDSVLATHLMPDADDRVCSHVLTGTVVITPRP